MFQQSKPSFKIDVAQRPAVVIVVHGFPQSIIAGIVP
jgi:hypothetical protein